MLFWRKKYHHRGSRRSLRISRDVEIDSNACIWTNEQPSSFVALPGGRIVIGPEAFFNCGVWIRAKMLVNIGARCLIGPRVMIMDYDGHELGEERRHGGVCDPVRISDGAWIGAAAIILKGVEIGEGTIVGAGSVVTKSCVAQQNVLNLLE